MLLGRFAPQAFALLRIVSGVMFLLHGTQKLLGWPPMEGMKGPLPTIALVAAVIEVVCGLSITLGFFAEWGAFIAAGEMAVAFWGFHARMAHNIIPHINKGEDAVLYCFIFLYIAAHGSGIWSVDSAMRRGAHAVT